MTKITYSRAVAVEEGFRKSVEIDKSCMKRPVLTHLYADYKNKDFYKEREELLNNVTTFSNGKVERSFKRGFRMLKGKDPKMASVIKKMNDINKPINLDDAVSLESFSNKTLYVYIEKQEGNIYTARNIPGLSMEQIYDLDLGNFYEIAGRLVYINLSKKNNVYKVNQIVKAVS